MTASEAEDFWDNAPSGHLITHINGRIIRANNTFLRWLGVEPGALDGKAIGDLLTVGSRIHYDTHFSPVLRMRGELAGVTVDFVGPDGSRLPMFLTANIRTGVDGRAELVRVTAVDATDRRSYERELLTQRRQAEADRARVALFADTLRRSLLPPVLAPPNGLDAADYYHAASVYDIGGDFYDLFPLSPATWGFFLGDVVGKGVDAAVLTGLARYALRSAAVSDQNPVRVLHNLNSVLDQKVDVRGSKLCTLIYGNLTKQGDGFDVELASGGHPPPLLLAGDGSAYYADTVGGQAVGMTMTPHFVASRFHLGPGDTLVLYTDGLTEASTGMGRERYDDDGALLRFAEAHSPASASSIVEAVRTLLEGMGSGVEDDTALLALGVPPQPEMRG